jgi:glutamyl-tRNA reductase
MNEKRSLEHFWVAGLNYKKTDAAIRGLFAVCQEQYDRLLDETVARGSGDMFILSTCNRTEIYGFGEHGQDLVATLCSGGKGDMATFNEVGYVKNGTEAINHLFQVAAGLDSQILGDYEILGQIKKAVKQSKEHGCIGAFTERLVNCVIQASKAVKTNTALSGGTVSVSFAAVQYVRQYMEQGNFDEVVSKTRIMLVGTGKIGKVTCRNIIDYIGAKNVVLLNRTDETAQELAKELGVAAAPYSDLEQEANKADVILVSTNAPEPIILERHLRGGHKLVIDMSIPANVDCSAQHLPGITFVDVDALSRIKDETLLQRKAEVPKALEIIDTHIADFLSWYDMRKQVPVLKEVRSKLQAIQIDPMLLKRNAGYIAEEDRLQKVINSMATRMRRDYMPGCHFIAAINDYIA